ncbi:bifunctional phosphoribosylaminoimidazolecarboxamide formyltransferase/IMP cyclohydrolase [bacterium]|nr:bifunctional phosphoribosylaminoimidazolecarboxamide formyltransferase/IMP cyclohydrolase [bacterium]
MGNGAELNRPRRALLSVTDKTDLDVVADALKAHGYELIASGGTAAWLRDHGCRVVDVSEVTGFPEVFGGRVKTLHPLVFGGILGPDEAAFAGVAELGLRPVDVVVCNLYDFEAAIEGGADEAGAIEKIDIGGPSLLRAAAKNFRRVCVLPSPDYYEEFADACDAGGGLPDLEFRRRMAAQTFETVLDYDMAISEWFQAESTADTNLLTLRYGENPHQAAEMTVPIGSGEGPLAGMGLLQLNGKELSYNNMIDVIAAGKLAADLDGVACAAIKHTNPCGVGTGATAAAALERALLCDPESAFGGIFAFTSEVDLPAAEILAERFCEVILAPSYSADALARLQKKKNLRVLAMDPALFTRTTSGRSLSFGEVNLFQDEDMGFPELDTWEHVAGPAPDAATLDALRLNWKVCKHVKSNAIVLGNAEGTLGIGAGQMSRVDSTRIAVRKAGDQELELKGCACASDAFFPFADSMERLHEVGVAAAVAPKGSIRDDEVIAAAERLGITLMHTDRRHFRH